MYMFGDFTSYVPNDNYNCVLVAGINTAYSGNFFVRQTGAGLTEAFSQVNSTIFVPRGYKQTGQSVRVGRAASSKYNYTTVAGYGGNPTYQGTNTWYMSNVYLIEYRDNTSTTDFVTRGIMPGLYFPAGILPGMSDGNTITTGTGTLSGKTLMSVPMVDSSSSSAYVMIETSDTW